MTTAIQSKSSSRLPASRILYAFGMLIRRPEAGSFFGTVAVLAFFTAVGGNAFVSAAGFAGWLNVAAEVGIVALPIGLLMIAGELDLSIGAVIPASSLSVAIACGHYGASEVVGIAVALAIGLLVGLVNGVLVLRTGMPSLIVTIGTMFAVMGLTLGLAVLLTDATSTPIVPSAVSMALFGQLVGDMFEMSIAGGS